MFGVGEKMAYNQVKLWLGIIGVFAIFGIMLWILI